MEKYQKLREEYPRFFYRGYDISEDDRELFLTDHFEIEGLSSFAPTWRFPKRAGESKEWAEDKLMQEMIFSLGMVELVSYWKITCSPQVILEVGSLNEEQIAWWKDLYFNGLGEFFYVNQIWEAKPQGFMNLVCRKPEEASCLKAEEKGSFSGNTLTPEAKKGVLVPIGGGKDSAVTLELLRDGGYPVYGYIINPRGATIHTTEAAGLDGAHVITVKRTLDPAMLELNKQGFLNGHTPFSALVAFSSIIAARIMGLSYIALSNESSANESTVLGSTVNHQYSKSFQFEKDFNRYEERYLPGSALYFSMLRPLSEFQIAGYFAKKKQYHSIFRSCNVGSKTDSWCGRCPKCLFVYLILSPFLSRQEVRDIFGRDMLEDGEMKPLLKQLTGVSQEKPFECVGSRDEVNAAIVMTIDRLLAEGERLPLLFEYYRELGLYETYKPMGNRYASYFDEENLLPEEWAELVRENCVQRREL